MSEEGEGNDSNLGLFGTAFSILIGLILIIAEARSGQPPTDTGPLLLYGVGGLMIGAPSVHYYFQLKGIDIDIGKRVGIHHLEGSNAANIEMRGGSLHLHQEARADTETGLVDRPDHEDFAFSQDFGLWENGDGRAFPFQLGPAGDGLVGYVSASDDVSAHFLTRRNMRYFENGDPFTTEWHTEKGTYLQINFTPSKLGVYHLLVTNADDLEDYESSDDHDEDEDKIRVQVRINSARNVR